MKEMATVLFIAIAALVTMVVLVIHKDNKDFDKFLASASRDPGKAKGFLVLKKGASMYVIINARTNEFVCGTDRRYSPPHQITSDSQMLTFDTFMSAASAFLHRKCGSKYKIAELETIHIKKVLEPPRSWDEYDAM